LQSAAVASSSSLKSADSLALGLARQFEFEPSPIADANVRSASAPTIGRLVFTWQVIPPTNAPATTASVP
jgi:hypothetical protein